jgi:hypothetical protein
MKTQTWCAVALAMGILGAGGALAAAPKKQPAPEAPQPSLCKAPEVTLFTCVIHTKLASVCGVAPGQSVYRFGRPGAVELEGHNLKHNLTGFSGGGDEQIYFSHSQYRYIAYANAERTGFGSDGLLFIKFSSGVRIQKNEKDISNLKCSNDANIMNKPSRYMTEGDYIER